VLWAALAAGLAACGPACGRRGGEGPPRAPAAIVAPDGSLIPVARPVTEGLEPVAREILRDRERRLEGSLAARASKPELAVAYGELGKAYQAFDLNEPAVACYENARRLAPSAFAWQYLLGRALDSLKRPDAAVAALEQALTIEDASLPALLYLGDVQAAAGRLEEARDAYRRALRASPDSAAAAFALGRIALLSGDAREAIPHLERALAVDPGLGRAHYILAIAYRQVGDLRRSGLHMEQRGERVPVVADLLWDEVAEINPRNYAARALQALRSGNARRAVALLRAESAALPDDVEVRIQLGIALSSAGSNREAVAEFRQALRMRPGHPRALYYLGAALALMGRYEEAVLSLRQAVQRNPGSAEAHLALARALRRLDRHAEARGPVAEAVRLDPTSVEARLEEGRLLARLAECGESAARLEKGLDVFAAHPSLTALLARVLAACPPAADVERARRLAREAFASEGSAESAATVAFVLAARGDWTAAEVWQRRALRLLPAESPKHLKEPLARQLQAIEARRLEPEW
jgi:tetratricopeptide (TPR) repeat protein